MVFRKTIFNYPVQISLILVLVFSLQMATNQFDTESNYFVLQSPLAEEPWTIITSVFSHSDINHLTSNIIGLIVFGLPVALKSDKVRFYLFFVTTGIIAGISQILVAEYMFNPEGTVGVLGSSGAIFALLGYLITSNRVSKNSFRLLKFPKKLRYVIYFVIAFWITIATATPQAALIAHFVGLMLGLTLGKNNVLKRD